MLCIQRFVGVDYWGWLGGSACACWCVCASLVSTHRLYAIVLVDSVWLVLCLVNVLQLIHFDECYALYMWFSLFTLLNAMACMSESGNSVSSVLRSVCLHQLSSVSSWLCCICCVDTRGMLYMLYECKSYAVYAVWMLRLRCWYWMTSMICVCDSADSLW